jgi:hypothetical protein
VDACISGHIKLEHVITCTFGCTNGEMHVESFSDGAAWFSLLHMIIRKYGMERMPYRDSSPGTDMQTSAFMNEKFNLGYTLERKSFHIPMRDEYYGCITQ